MTAVSDSKTLQCLVENEWVVDGILSLGSGYVTFLVYPNSEIAPPVRDDIGSHAIGEGIWVEILHLEKNTMRRIALAEVKQINDFQSFIRFDFLILNVIPFLRDGKTAYGSQYHCFYKESQN